MTSSINIHSVGPINDVRIELKRINVFMGAQASGKSTIAKIISQALWAEKKFLTTGEENNFYRSLIDFHNFQRSYFKNKEFYITYESPWCKITLKYEEGKRDPQTRYEKVAVSQLYHNPKISYIPAERNFVASIANIRKYSEKYNNLINFLNEWFSAKDQYQRKNKFDVDFPELNFSYRYIQNSERDIIILSNGEELDLYAASSGQQSVLPLFLMAKSTVELIYQLPKTFSPIELANIKKLSPEHLALVDLLNMRATTKKEQKLNDDIEKLWSSIGYRGDYGLSHLIIEEPEQNLYPPTQRGLVKELVRLIKPQPQRAHTLTLTTHSPYILYALHNCMLAGEVGTATAEKSVDKFAPPIAPNEVAVWLLKEGYAISLQEQETHRLKESSFNEEMQRNHEEMFQILQFLRHD